MVYAASALDVIVRSLNETDVVRSQS